MKRIVFAVLVVVPLIASLTYAAAYSVGLTGLLSRGVTLAHWQAVLTAHETWASLALTLLVAGSVAVIAVALALPVAIAVSDRLDDGVVSRALYAPLVLPGTVLANVVLAVSLHTPGNVFIGGELGIVVAHVIGATPFMVLTLRGIARGERMADLEMTAALLGASRRQRLMRVVVPLLVRRSVPAMALVFFLTAGAYEVPLVLGRQAPQMFAVLVMRKLSRFDLYDKPQGMALVTLYALAVSLVVGVLVRRFAREVRT